MKQVILLVISLITNPAFGEFLPSTKIFEALSYYDAPLVMYVTVPQEQPPFYKDGVLSVPRVDIDGQQGTGIFQNGKFVITEQGTWRLVDFTVSGTNNRFYIGSVETIITDSFPTQVFLKIIGRANSTSNFANVSLKAFQRLVGNSFEISLYDFDKGNPSASLSQIETYAPMSILSNTDIERMKSTVGFDDPIITVVAVVPLSVYGLRAGTYQYNVIGNKGFYTDPFFPVFTGTFELKKDNRF